ncbi:glycoprotease family-domain-containing protein [Aspergillus pseudoustus]|uniref:Glycoprotease family-domain-containing protein n=1 Tax=Aspergillus pseudoustus TaxID=1810923 RepID=A0ABR4IXA4_9EURO
MLARRVATIAGRKTLCPNARLRTFAARRGLLTLAIETSCDDTSVAIVSKQPSGTAKIHFLENITSNSTKYEGIHPIRALESHQQHLAKLVDKALRHLPPASELESLSEISLDKIVALPGEIGGVRQKPDFVCATRGPGMRSNLFTGLDTAKGLSVAWQVPFLGVHHMQAHLLTPRLVYALPPSSTSNQIPPAVDPSFPFLSILASGGHTQIVSSTSLTDHTILAESTDTALGESLDKAARVIVPPEALAESQTTMYGALLEKFAFPNGPADYADYKAPADRHEEIQRAKVVQPSGWSLTVPYAEKRELALSFAPLETRVKDIIAGKGEWWGEPGELDETERRLLAREAMRVSFEHLASRTILALEHLCTPPPSVKHPGKINRKRRQKMRPKPNPGLLPVTTLVVSGGVAANAFLMRVLRAHLDARGFGDVQIVAPPPKLCTDNAAMIGWAGIEMYEAGWRSDLSVRALRKWLLDSEREAKSAKEEEGTGGILGVGGWVNVLGRA